MRSFFEELAGGQKPHTMFITCADSRIDPSLITQSAPGEIFVHRNAGNMVPAFSDAPSSEAASLEFAVCVLGVADIVVCGHSHCGAVAGMANPEMLRGLDHVASWLDQAGRTVRDGTKTASDIDDPLLPLAEHNVVVQLDHLRGYPFVKERIASGDLSVNGLVYLIGTGEIRVHQPNEERFVSLALAFD